MIPEEVVFFLHAGASVRIHERENKNKVTDMFFIMLQYYKSSNNTEFLMMTLALDNDGPFLSLAA